MYPNNYLYSKEHEWIQVDGDTAILGITKFAQSELGEIVYFEAPEVGQRFEEDDEIGTIESVKAVSSIFTPVAGQILEVNAGVDESPEIVNDDPHGEGWLVKIQLASTDALDALMSAEDYAEFLKSLQDEV